MMRKSAYCLCGALLSVGIAVPAFAASNTDPDWPCVQRKVPELSLAQIWAGPELPGEAEDWRNDPDIAELVEEVAARRVPIEDAQHKIREFGADLASGERQPKLTMLAHGLFDHMNAERAQVISGIGRYARKQVEMATALRRERSDIEAQRSKHDADANEIAIRTDRLTWQTRIFQERAQSLSFVCEVPTLIEQRLYQLAKTVAETMTEE